MAKYKLKEGVVLEPYGENSSITNENITDSIAEYLIGQGRANIEDFEPIDEEEQAPAAPVVETKLDVTPPIEPVVEVSDKTTSSKSKQTPAAPVVETKK